MLVRRVVAICALELAAACSASDLIGPRARHGDGSVKADPDDGKKATEGSEGVPGYLTAPDGIQVRRLPDGRVEIDVPAGGIAPAVDGHVPSDVRVCAGAVPSALVAEARARNQLSLACTPKAAHADGSFTAAFELAADNDVALSACHDDDAGTTAITAEGKVCAVILPAPPVAPDPIKATFLADGVCPAEHRQFVQHCTNSSLPQGCDLSTCQTFAGPRADVCGDVCDASGCGGWHALTMYQPFSLCSKTRLPQCDPDYAAKIQRSCTLAPSTLSTGVSGDLYDTCPASNRLYLQDCQPLGGTPSTLLRVFGPTPDVCDTFCEPGLCPQWRALGAAELVCNADPLPVCPRAMPTNRTEGPCRLP